MANLFRYYGKRKYRNAGIIKGKSDATKAATKVRLEGNRARIEKLSDGYYRLWVAPKSQWGFR